MILRALWGSKTCAIPPRHSGDLRGMAVLSAASILASFSKKVQAHEHQFPGATSAVLRESESMARSPGARTGSHVGYDAMVAMRCLRRQSSFASSLPG